MTIGIWGRERRPTGYTNDSQIRHRRVRTNDCSFRELFSGFSKIGGEYWLRLKDGKNPLRSRFVYLGTQIPETLSHLQEGEMLVYKNDPKTCVLTITDVTGQITYVERKAKNPSS